MVVMMWLSCADDNKHNRVCALRDRDARQCNVRTTMDVCPGAAAAVLMILLPLNKNTVQNNTHRIRWQHTHWLTGRVQQEWQVYMVCTVCACDLGRMLTL